MNSITCIYSPYHVGIRDDEVGAGPYKIREHGVIKVIRDLGLQVHEVEVKPSMKAEGEIGRSFELFRQTSKLVTEARNAGSFPIVLAGNCSTSVGVHAGLSGSHELKNKDIGCVWFDAHDDFNIPATVLSGYFDSQAIAIMAGQSWDALVNTIPGYRRLKPDHVVHIGMRDVNNMERARVVEAGFPVVWANSEQPVDFVAELETALGHSKQHETLIHLDLDCLSASVGQVNKFEPAPGGLATEDLARCLSSLATKVEPTALTVASYDPQHDADGRVAGVAVEAIQSFVQALLKAGLVKATGDKSVV